MKQIFHVDESWMSLPIIGLDAGAAAGLGALAIAITAAFLANFVQTPILDYDVMIPSGNTNESEYEIKINNYGNAPAGNVIMNLEQEGTKFVDFTSNPYLNKYLIEGSSDKSNGKG